MEDGERQRCSNQSLDFDTFESSFRTLLFFSLDFPPCRGSAQYSQQCQQHKVQRRIPKSRQIPFVPLFPCSLSPTFRLRASTGWSFLLLSFFLSQRVTSTRSDLVNKDSNACRFVDYFLSLSQVRFASCISSTTTSIFSSTPYLNSVAPLLWR